MPKRRSLPLDDASPQMKTLAAWCIDHGLNVRRTSSLQLKIGPFNVWPDAGTWNRDDDLKRKSGLRLFREAVERWGHESGIWVSGTIIAFPL